MSAQVFADKWEWLSKQSNWRRILNDTGIRNIKKGITVEKIIEIVKAQFPNVVLPFDAEGQSAFQVIKDKKIRHKRYKTLMNDGHRQHMLWNDKYENLLFKYKNLLLGKNKEIHRAVFIPNREKKDEYWGRFGFYVNYLYKNDFCLHPATKYYMFSEIDIPAYIPAYIPAHSILDWVNPFHNAGIDLNMWVSFIHMKVQDEFLKLECYLSNAELEEKPQNLPTLPKHICQEYFDFAKMAMIEKKCIVCFESDNMLLSTCGHVICRGCFVELKNQPQFKCPECRTVFPKE